MHRKLHVPDMDNPTVPQLSPQAASMLQRAPLLAIGTLDEQGRPWTTVWGGAAGFSQPLGRSIVGVRTPVATRFDPVVEHLVGKEVNGEVVREEGVGRLVGGLSIDLETRKRVKLQGRMVAGALGERKVGEEDAGGFKDQSEIQLVFKVDQSLGMYMPFESGMMQHKMLICSGNCPKYLNKKQIVPAPMSPTLLSDTTPLPPGAVLLLAKADLFFLSTSHDMHDMDTNHRGGAPGFVRLLSNTPDSTVLVYPEYSGNRLYQSLGNMLVNPLAGLCFPDFETGDCLYLTGRVEVLIGVDAASILPRSNLAVKLTVTAARYVVSVLPFRGKEGEASPYNPAVRHLTSEHAPRHAAARTLETAKLLQQTQLTPTISRFRFALSNPATYTAGQYVTLDFAEHLDVGYSHMRDDDPRSLNDDYVRTFTVSSPPGLPPRPSARLADDEFEITIRRVGTVTGFLFKHGLTTSRSGSTLEVDVKGFDGTFEVRQEDSKEEIGFFAAGVGITPLMPCLGELVMDKLHLLWSLRKEDLGLALDVLERHPQLTARMKLFLTGTSSGDGEQEKRQIDRLREHGVDVQERRSQRKDLEHLGDVKRWYVCMGTQQRLLVSELLSGKEVLHEDFNF